ncbi:neuromedin-K receptor-like [Anneissia japonica]|uniref:neuromedin-K receptor-like n=1 Tax=Anneissia japonica TaxID=1529436 RepID=UPI00142578C4|nr:neuromedin-K receptor-like [Anneissia japonica]
MNGDASMVIVNSTTVGLLTRPTNSTVVTRANPLSLDISQYPSEVEHEIEDIHIPPIVYYVLFMFNVLMIVVSNSLVIVAVLRSKVLRRSVTNILITSLCASDILAGIFYTPALAYISIYSEMPLNLTVCRVFVGFFPMVAYSASWLSIFAIAVDRFRAIVQPLKPRISHNVCYIMIFFVWGISIFFGSFKSSLLHSVTYTVWEGDHLITRQTCDITLEKLKVWIIIDITLYLLLLFSVSLIYCIIAHVLWFGGRSIPTLHQARQESKKRAIKMFVCVVFLFSICWLPYYVLIFYTDFINGPFYGWGLANFVTCLITVSNSWMDPFIYGYYNENFRREIKKIFKSLFFGNKAVVRDHTVPDNRVRPLKFTCSRQESRLATHACDNPVIDND